MVAMIGKQLVDKKVVVFNHSPNLLHLYHVILSQKKYEVVQMLEELESLKHLQDVLPHLIILGNIRGFIPSEFDFLTSIRTIPDFDHIPILICTTAIQQVEMTIQDWQIANTAVIEKPFNARIFIGAVESLLGQGV